MSAPVNRSHRGALLLFSLLLGACKEERSAPPTAPGEYVFVFSANAQGAALFEKTAAAAP